MFFVLHVLSIKMEKGFAEMIEQGCMFYKTQNQGPKLIIIGINFEYIKCFTLLLLAVKQCISS